MLPNDNTVGQTKKKRSKLQAHLIRPEGGYIREGGVDKAQGWDDALMQLGTAGITRISALHQTQQRRGEVGRIRMSNPLADHHRFVKSIRQTGAG